MVEAVAVAVMVAVVVETVAVAVAVGQMLQLHLFGLARSVAFSGHL